MVSLLAKGMFYFIENQSSKTGLSWFDWAVSFFHTHPIPEERILANDETWKVISGK